MSEGSSEAKAVADLYSEVCGPDKAWRERLEADGPVEYVAKLHSAIFGPDAVGEEYHEDLRIGWQVYRAAYPDRPTDGLPSQIGAFFIARDMRKVAA